eukprot:m.105824 g.105824  ORF g.105824 m.105824 type:complete len:715 (+) comp15742_c0_seq2:1-2145(+)
MKDNNLVRRLDACETMGGATTICSDKTGTLTQNKMTVIRGWLLGQEFGPDSPFHATAHASPLLQGIAINSTASLTTGDDGNARFVGNKTECALLEFATSLDKSFDADELRHSLPTAAVYAFSSERKNMATSIFTDGKPLPDNFDTPSFPDREITFHVKGASEVVLSMCGSVLQADGSVGVLDGPLRETLTQHIQSMAEDSLRTLAIAYKTSDSARDWTLDGEDAGLVIFGIVGIRDPLRPDVPDAVAKCQRAGIVVRMLTGDNIITAKHIAEACGIYDPAADHICMEGPQFRELSREELDRIAPKLRVMARCSPTDKLTLVAALQRHREVVAVTGDGVNDGPALKKADVGFSMGIAGTDVAKEASAIVLLDDSFASVVSAVRWGRGVFDNVRKFLQFQLTVNFTAILFLFIVIIADPDGRAESAPLKSVQLLWVNLIMDTLAAVALATETAKETVLLNKPYDKNEPLLTAYSARRMIMQVVMQTATFLVVLYAGEDWFSSHKDPLSADDQEAQFGREHYTVAFNVFVFSQLFNEINSRKLKPALNVFKGLGSHQLFVVVWVFAFAVQVMLVTFGGSFSKTTPLSIYQWLGCVGVGMLPLVWTFLWNLLPRWFIYDPSVFISGIMTRFFSGKKRIAAAENSSSDLLRDTEEAFGSPDDDSNGVALHDVNTLAVPGPRAPRPSVEIWQHARWATVTQIGVVNEIKAQTGHRTNGLA